MPPMTHSCCEKLHYYLTEPELSEQIALRYSPHGRYYGISVLDGEHVSAGNPPPKNWDPEKQLLNIGINLDKYRLKQDSYNDGNSIDYRNFSSVL